MAELSVLNKVLDITVRSQTFLPEGAREPITYYTLVLHVDFNGEPDEVLAKLKLDAVKLLKAADPVDKTEK